MKTDDRMRLAKERREERERSLGKRCSVVVKKKRQILLTVKLQRAVRVLFLCRFPAVFFVMKRYSLQFNWLRRGFASQ